MKTHLYQGLSRLGTCGQYAVFKDRLLCSRRRPIKNRSVVSTRIFFEVVNQTSRGFLRDAVNPGMIDLSYCSLPELLDQPLSRLRVLCKKHQTTDFAVEAMNRIKLHPQMPRNEIHKPLMTRLIVPLGNKAFSLFDKNDTFILVDDFKNTIAQRLLRGLHGFMCHSGAFRPRQALWIGLILLVITADPLASQTAESLGNLRIRLLLTSDQVREPEVRSRLSADPDFCSKPLNPDSRVEAGYLSSALVWLESPSLKVTAKEKSQKETIQIEACQLNRRFVFMDVQDQLEVINLDPINYDLRFWSYDESEFFMSLPPNLKSQTVQLDDPKIYHIRGILHPHLEAFAIVRKHEFYGLTDQNGAVSLNKIPRGEYRVHLWHPILGFEILREPIQVDSRSQDRELIWPIKNPSTP